MPDTIFLSLSNFHNSRWPPRWPPIVYVHRNDPGTLTLCMILMNFESFSRVSMMPNPMSMVPITSTGRYHTRKTTHVPLRTSIFLLVLRWWPRSKPVTCISRDCGEYARHLESRDNSCKQSLGGSVNKHSCRHQ